MWWRIKRWLGFGLPQFKPCVIYNEPLRLTEMILEDTSIVWSPWGPKEWGHAVDCGYSFDGRLVGIKIWDDVRFRIDPSEGGRWFDSIPGPKAKGLTASVGSIPTGSAS